MKSRLYGKSKNETVRLTKFLYLLNFSFHLQVLKYTLELLQKRVSEDFVKDSVNALETKINRDLEKINKRDTAIKDKLANEATARIAVVSRNLNEDLAR